MEKTKALLRKLKIDESTISMILGILVVLVIGTLVINYFRNIHRSSSEEAKEKVTEEVKEEIEEIKLEELPVVYKVKKGDSLWKIAEGIYGSGYNWVDIAKENNLKNPNILLSEQELKIPKVEPIKPKTTQPNETAEPITGEIYTVVKGDNLWQIAVRAYGDGYQWVKIARENKLANPDLIHPGNTFKIPR